MRDDRAVDPVRRAIVDELFAASRAHDARQTEHAARYRNVEPDTAELLALLIVATGARRILELGTSNGYSTIWLADAAHAGGGHLTSVEIDPRRTGLARANLARAGLGAELRAEDAADTLAASPDGAWDFVFLDADRSAYAAWWPDLARVLRPRGGLLAIDNVRSHPHEVAAVGALIDADEGVSSKLVPIGAGLRLVVRRGRIPRASAPPS
jgi:predicted O-methyltransferase YrrM